MKLQINESPVDRIIRIVLGIALFAFAAVGGLTAPVLYIVWLGATIALVTSVVGFCPLYAIFRFSTQPAHR